MHTHPLTSHTHPLTSHTHPLTSHAHPLTSHAHPLTASLSVWLESMVGCDVWSHAARVGEILTPKEFIRDVLEDVLVDTLGMQGVCVLCVCVVCVWRIVYGG